MEEKFGETSFGKEKLKASIKDGRQGLWDWACQGKVKYGNEKKIVENIRRVAIEGQLHDISDKTIPEPLKTRAVKKSSALVFIQSKRV